MSNVQVNMVLRPYDQFCPLILGNVPTPGIDLTVDFRGSIGNEFADGVDVGEVSFNRYVMGYANGDRRLVGIPAFVLRGFRHRNYIVRRDSSLTSLSDLRGKRIGCNSWSDSGTLWARQALRDAGVDIGDVRWVIGHLDETTKLKPRTPQDVPPPPGTEFLPDDGNLMAEMMADRIDAITTAFMPDMVFTPDGAARRLVVDFRSAETEFHKRTGIYPAFHVMAFRREFAERHPAAVVAVYEALRASWRQWWTKAKNFGETSPWATAEVETMLADFADDTPPFGHTSPATRRMLAVMCQEQVAQGLVQSSADPDQLFRDFEAMLSAPS
ncbi:nitrate ABC transporter substrate-binding protein [Mesorhizobium sp. 8]|uniref:ABC transporter substrate-binding protein n=1 Tax=Mesorhizobium sp. 8 TaxID=2584466 RepID=UPI001122C724|nr:nitrate ABC transporter substrate-binding protein [Mesorhizobium sp. 8]QDC02331.1 nitrate ABC transporter substrate-binding protein [Mesorhizobium sp. 8]